MNLVFHTPASSVLIFCYRDSAIFFLNSIGTFKGNLSINSAERVFTPFRMYIPGELIYLAQCKWGFVVRTSPQLWTTVNLKFIWQYNMLKHHVDRRIALILMSDSMTIIIIIREKTNGKEKISTPFSYYNALIVDMRGVGDWRKEKSYEWVVKNSKSDKRDNKSRLHFCRRELRWRVELLRSFLVDIGER